MTLAGRGIEPPGHTFDKIPADLQSEGLRSRLKRYPLGSIILCNYSAKQAAIAALIGGPLAGFHCLAANSRNIKQSKAVLGCILAGFLASALCGAALVSQETLQFLALMLVLSTVVYALAGMLHRLPRAPLVYLENQEWSRVLLLCVFYGGLFWLLLPMMALRFSQR
ncbi:MAG: hypothetical protein U0800_24275 [Isosphaeraceae bacterium]